MRTKFKKKQLTAYMFILPSIILLIVFHVIPILMSIFFSFTEYNTIQPPVFNGLSNYRRLIKDSFVSASLFNTLVYTVLVVPIQTALSMVLAYLIAKKSQNKWGDFVRSALFIPVITSMIMVGTIWRILLASDSGIVNQFLEFLRLPAVNWLGARWPALLSVCFIGIWKNVGYFLVIYYAGIMDIPESLYESAKVDGATETQLFFRITLPMLKDITYLVVTLGTIWSFQVFDLVYTMTGGGPGRATVTLVLTIYEAAFKEYKMGYASAVSVLLLVIIIIISAIQKMFFNDEDSKKGGVKVG